jgi:hypothetical protein
LSLSNGEDGRLLAYCFGGHSYPEIVLALVEHGLLDDDGAELDAPPGGQASPDRDDADQRRRIQRAQEIYASGVRDKRIDDYLWSRRLKSGSDVLRFAEAAPHRTGIRLPAMLAPIVDVNGEQIGVHLTYLRADSRGKVDLPKDLQRESRGAIKGGAIRLHPYRGDWLIVSEGIESGLAATEIFHEPCWAAVYAGGLKTLALPAFVTRILVAADHDEAGRQCALAARDRWTAEGREVRVKVSPAPGQDFNDVLLGRRRDARP